MHYLIPPFFQNFKEKFYWKFMSCKYSKSLNIFLYLLQITITKEQLFKKLQVNFYFYKQIRFTTLWNTYTYTNTNIGHSFQMTFLEVLHTEHPEMKIVNFIFPHRNKAPSMRKQNLKKKNFFDILLCKEYFYNKY